MSAKSIYTSMFAVTTAAGIFLTAGLGSAIAGQRLAMHEMMPMQQQVQMQPQGQMQMQPQGQMPMQPQGQMPVAPQGQMPVPPQGQMPVHPQGQTPMQPQGQMPVQPQGQMPVAPQGQMPVQPQGQMPVQPQGQLPMQPQGQMPVQPQGWMTGGMAEQHARMMDDHMRMMNDQMRLRGQMPGMAMGPGAVDLTDRIEGRLAFLRAELQITEAQASAWNTFADALRSSRQHVMEARQQLNQPYSNSTDRLEQYERHLAARFDAVKTARKAVAQLYTSLDDAQKRTADDLVAPFIATF